MIKRLAFLILFLLSWKAYAIDIQIRDDGKTGFNIRQNSSTRFEAIYTLATIKTLPVGTPLGDFTDLIIPDFTASGLPGSPKIPGVARLIDVPFGAEIRLKIIEFSFIEYDLDSIGLSDIIPAQPPQIKSENGNNPFTYDSIVYTQNSFYPSLIGEAAVIGISRGVRIGRLQLSPVQYNPVTKILRVYSEIHFEVEFLHPDFPMTKAEKRKNFSPYFRDLSTQLINARPETDAPLDTITQYPVKFVIVSAPIFQAALQPFITWKKKKGFNVVEAYTNNPTVGATTTSIKAYLQGLYNAGSATDPAPSFVLFVGDVAQIPAFSGTQGGHPSDLYYCEYTGDYLPEIFYGRFSATTVEQLQPQLDKTLQYEQYLMPDPSFLGHAVMIAGADASFGPTHANPQINYGTSTYFNLAHGIQSHTYLYPNSSSQAAQIRLDVSNGCCFANYTAHGSSSGWADPSFLVSHVAAMTNSGKYPLMVGNACLTNKFNDAECFGEALLRASGKGALGYIGASNNTYWDEDFYWACGAKPIITNPTYLVSGLGAYDRTFHDHGEAYSNWFTTQGQMVYAGNLAVNQGAPSSAAYYWEIYHLMGDPSLSVFYAVPPALGATYNSILPISSNTFTLTTEPYAYCAISESGVLKGAAQAGADGIAVVHITPFAQAVTANVVVTKQNFQPFSGTVSVANPNTPMCMYVSNLLNDNTGNNNGQPDLGETVLMGLAIQNVGLLPASNVTVSIGTTDPYITITDNSQAYGNFVAGATLMIPDGFAFNVANNIPDNHAISFSVNATDGNATWTSSFIVIAHAPVISYQGNIVSDPTGNNNGKLDPGETASLTITIQNSGSCLANAVTGNLSCNTSFVTISSNNQSFGNIAGGSSSSAVFSLNVGAGVPQGQIAVFTLNISGSNGLTSTAGFSIVIGQSPVLIINWDGNGNAATAIQSALSANSISCLMSTSLPASLSDYDALFISLGIYSDNHVLTASEGTAIASFINAGGNVYMEGGDTWYYDTQTTAHALFKITGTSDGSSDLSTVNGTAGTFTEGLGFTYSGDNNWIDHLTPTSGSTASVILNNSSPAYGTAIAYSGSNYKTIGASHEFAGLGDGSYPSTKNELMRRYLEFFGLINPLVTTVSGTVSYNNTNQTPIQGVTVSLMQGATIISTTSTDANGLYNFATPPTGQFTIRVTSSQAWGGVNSTDALLILKHFVGLSSLNGLRMLAGNVDNSAIINSIDALAVQKRFTGMISSFPAGNWIFENPSVNITGNSAQTMNIKGLCYGDVNGSFTPVYP